MNFNRIRRIDRFVGVPLCFLFTLWRKGVARFWQQTEEERWQEAPKKILFIKLIEQGSTVLTYDTLLAAVERVGRDNVYFWIFSENKPVLDLLEIIPEKNIFNVRSKPFLTFVVDILKSIVAIRRAKIEAVIDMEFYARAPALLSYLTGARIRVGLHRFTAEAPYRGDLMTHRVNYNSTIHTGRFFRLLLESAYLDPNDLPMPKIKLSNTPIRLKKLVPELKEVAQLKEKLFKLSPRLFDGPIVLFNANASDMIPIRKWDSAKYIELGHKLFKDYPNATILFTGAPSERDGIETIVRTMNHERALSVAGVTTFRELIILYTLSDVLVTNDSGPGHFASLTDIYGITLFGPETPILYSALGENKVFVSSELACSPCVSIYNHRFSPCNNNRCMQELTVDRVYRELKMGMQIKIAAKEVKVAASI